MRRTPTYLLTDPDEVKRLIRENPWATIVSHAATGLVASHYPVVLEEDAEGISIVSHVGRPDEQLHELGEHEILVIIQGPHGYISPSAYDEGDVVPTWNHVTAHLYGVPEILSDEENFRVRVTRFDARLKLSQNKHPHVRERIIAGLEGDGPYAQPELAEEMKRAAP